MFQIRPDRLQASEGFIAIGYRDYALLRRRKSR
jgi:hypothetical protein